MACKSASCTVHNPALNQAAMNRRNLLALGAGTLAAGSIAMFSGKAHAAEKMLTEPTRSPDQAMESLEKGNQRFVSDPQECEMDLAKQRASVAGGQAPWATILGCADSRVPPELVFGGRGLGELFVARNAGNLADTGTIGTLEFGAAVLGSPLIVVLGHSACGAVKSACEVVTDNATFPGSIGPMIDPIIPAALAVRGKDGDFADNSIRESAMRTAARLGKASAILAGLIDQGKLKIVAAHYDLATGKVEYLSQPSAPG
jgi:carbonic anhydrase